MAIEHARLCSSCERECPSWADRCPACGNASMFRRIVMIPAVATISRPEPVSLVTAGAKAPASPIKAHKRIKPMTPAAGAPEVVAR
jgi:predicted amidophosphoribosyltransferase